MAMSEAQRSGVHAAVVEGEADAALLSPLTSAEQQALESGPMNASVRALGVVVVRGLLLLFLHHFVPPLSF